jgi:tRNA-Thr(GGU) m(6)t(6)A37 methyltransferase TsaA
MVNVRRPTSKISHVDLVVSSLARSMPFYRGLLGPIGWSSPREMRGERGETIYYLSVEGPGVAALGLREKRSDAHGVPYDRYAVGLHHLCFDVLSPEIVDERAQWLREQGAPIESGPAEYDYTPGYYAVFFYDPDGVKLELLYRPTYWEWLRRPMDLAPIGRVESPLIDPSLAPNQGDEGAPEAWLVFEPAVLHALEGIRAGDEVVVITWLDRARRDVLRVHPRGDVSRAQQGVFSTRSPHRPNPIGLHRVEIVSIDGSRIRVRNLEAVHGTPIVDVKPVLSDISER